MKLAAMQSMETDEAVSHLTEPHASGVTSRRQRDTPNRRPTFAGALAAVRHALWREQGLAMSSRRRDRTKRRFVTPASWAYALCRAAWLAKVELRTGPKSDPAEE